MKLILTIISIFTFTLAFSQKSKNNNTTKKIGKTVEQNWKKKYDVVEEYKTTFYKEVYYWVVKNRKCGIADKNGVLTILCIYDYISKDDWGNGITRCEINDTNYGTLFGFVNIKTGITIVPVKYDDAWTYKDEEGYLYYKGRYRIGNGYFGEEITYNHIGKCIVNCELQRYNDTKIVNSSSNSNSNPCENAKIPAIYEDEGWKNSKKQISFRNENNGGLFFITITYNGQYYGGTKWFKTEREAIEAEYLYQKYGCH